MIRGEVWWTDLEPVRGSEIRKRRPTVILSASSIAQHRRTVVAVPLSTGPSPRWPLVVDLPSIGTQTVAVCDQLRALARSRFDKRLGAVSEADMTRLAEALKLVLDL